VDTHTAFAPVFPTPTPGHSDVMSLDPEMVELALLLPMAQATALENAAHSYGLSTGQLLRRIIKNSLATMNVVR
jgi:hypothetical protein